MSFVVILVASLVFGGLWWLLSRAGANAFVVAAVSFFFAALVIASQSLLGWKL